MPSRCFVPPPALLPPRCDRWPAAMLGQHKLLRQLLRLQLQREGVLLQLCNSSSSSGADREVRGMAGSRRQAMAGAGTPRCWVSAALRQGEGFDPGDRGWCTLLR